MSMEAAERQELDDLKAEEKKRAEVCDPVMLSTESCMIMK
jgi:hypothetical protein